MTEQSPDLSFSIRAEQNLAEAIRGYVQPEARGFGTYSDQQVGGLLAQLPPLTEEQQEAASRAWGGTAYLSLSTRRFIGALLSENANGLYHGMSYTALARFSDIAEVAGKRLKLTLIPSTEPSLFDRQTRALMTMAKLFETATQEVVDWFEEHSFVGDEQMIGKGLSAYATEASKKSRNTEKMFDWIISSQHVRFLRRQYEGQPSERYNALYRLILLGQVAGQELQLQFVDETRLNPGSGHDS